MPLKPSDYIAGLDAQAREAYEQVATPQARLLIDQLERHHSYSAAHSRRVAFLAQQCAQGLGLDADRVYVHALLHDVGKSEIPREILDSARDLDAAELELMRSHAVRGEAILQRGPFKDEAGTARSHHERFGGGGYPDDLSGQDIPFFARLVAACDSLEAMIAPERAYRAPLTLAQARAALVNGAGGQFDPTVVPALDAVCNELERPQLALLEVSSDRPQGPGSVQPEGARDLPAFR